MGMDFSGVRQRHVGLSRSPVAVPPEMTSSQSGAARFVITRTTSLCMRWPIHRSYFRFDPPLALAGRTLTFGRREARPLIIILCSTDMLSDTRLAHSLGSCCMS